ncbi:hypothetical protein [Streptomyces spectabilis]|uniref:Monoamine oxidase n=1 Tax=Streptomyces spectabilis TaxID=68270 RepID=A0A7W8B493_STRST|nr:hypothetical protein [Streptomyces spectabilis]MBB5110074.1 monoamine oxidase [Streptomyces spectabilis]GGV58106.1 hypothetical protein GCM10010245_91240 [Streptomyces spectabilis]
MTRRPNQPERAAGHGSGEGSLTASAVVIGGGITGLLAAAALAPSCDEVVLQ